MKTHPLVIVVFLFLFFTCEREFDNPVDSGLVISPIQNLSAVQQGENILLSWQKKAQVSTGYEIERKTCNGSWQQLVMLKDPKQTSYLDTNITNSVTYSYRIRGFSGDNQSEYSNIVVINNTDYFNEDPFTVALWRMNEGFGTTFFDLSVNDNHGTINGASWITGNFNNALSLDGQNDYLIVPHNASFITINNSKELTVEMWIKVYSYPPSNKEAILIDKWGAAGDLDDEFGMNLRSDGTVRAIVNSSTSLGSPNTQIFSSDPIQLNSWILICFTWNGNNNTAVIYVNQNIIAYTTQAVNSMPSTFAEIHIGGFSGEPTAAPFKGLIDEIRISNKVRE